MYLSRGQASASHACRTPLCLLSTPVCHLFIQPILRKSLHWETVGTSSEQNETPPPFNGTDVLGGGEQEGDKEMSLEG